MESVENYHINFDQNSEDLVATDYTKRFTNPSGH